MILYKTINGGNMDNELNSIDIFTKIKNRIFGEDEKSQGSASSRKIIFNINGNSQKNNSNLNKVKSK